MATKHYFMKIKSLLLLALGFCVQPASAHDTGNPNHDHTTSQLGTNRVSITVEGNYRVVRANGLPDHTPGTFPRRGNPNTISSQKYDFRMSAKPQIAEKPTPSRHASFGVALNGIPFDPATAEFWNNDMRSGWNYEAKGGGVDLGLDEYNAHVQPNGAYHYHGLPLGMMKKLGGDTKKMLLVGYAADGFPIYTSFGMSNPTNATSPLKKMRSSYKLKKGTRPSGPGGNYDGKFTEDYEFVKGSGDLDECNGRFGVTPEFSQGIYHYYLTDEFPNISRLWRGTPDSSFQKGGPGGLGGPGGPGGGPRRGPGQGAPGGQRPPPPDR